MSTPRSADGRGNLRLVLLDGHGLIHRAFHAVKEPLIARHSGEETTAVFGFTNTLLKVLEDLKPTHVAVAMDLPGPTFRHEQYVEYKAHRPGTPESLRHQIARVRELIQAFNIPIYEAETYEADDVLGTLARQAAEQGIETYLATLDSDILQLVRPGVYCYMYRLYQRDTVVYDVAGVRERYGFDPERMPDFKGLKGDASDNIPGVPGIGEKTAVKLIQQFGSIEALYENLWQVTPQKLQDKLREYEAQARYSKEIATIATDAPVTLDLERCRLDGYDRERVLELFRELEFRSLIDRLPAVEGVLPDGAAKAPAAVEAEAPAYHVVDTEEALAALAAKIREAGAVTLDTETTDQGAMTCGLVGISLSVRPYEAYYVPVGHVQSDGTHGQLPLETVRRHLAPVLADAGIAKTAHNAKFDMIVLHRHGMPVDGLRFDSMIAAFLLGEQTLSLKALAFDRLNAEMTPITDLIGKGGRAKQKSMAEVGIADVAAYACADADFTNRLSGVLEGELRSQNLWDLYTQVEMPLVPVLTRMEMTGVAVDTAVLREMSRELGEQLARIEEQIYQAVGHQFNVNSTQQLSQVLFEELKLPKSRRTKQGYSTDAASLETLRGAHPVIDLLLEYRQLSKLKSTYVDALPGLINPETGRVHSSFNQCGAATGRISSSEPNLQNIPVRTDVGRRIRHAFVARGFDDARLVAADYSQIEMRVLAHYSQDPALIEFFRQDLDIHAATAAQVYGVPLEQVTPAMRRVAKTVNFGVAYGISDYGLAARTELSREEAGAFIRAYFETYPGLKQYMDETIAQTRRLGYATTLLGRRRYLPEINSTAYNVRTAAERMAINMPIQGTEADIIKMAMTRVQQALDERRLRSRMILQVHDELMFECPAEEVEEVQALAREIMPRVMELSVPLKVDLKVGRHWGEME